VKNSIPPIPSSILLELITTSKWFLRSLKKGDWIWLMISVIIASATVTVVKNLGETVQQSMLRKAAESLGADFVIQSSRPIEKQWQIRAEELGLNTAQSISVVTMAIASDSTEEQHFQLVKLTGQSNNRPLRGDLTKSDEILYQPLTKGKVWVEPSLFSLIPLSQNSVINLGTETFTLAGSVQGQNLIAPVSNFAPEVWIPLEQLTNIGLLGAGSRANYKLSVIGPPEQILEYANLIRSENNAHWQLLSAEAPSEDLGNSLNTAWLFLDLSALSAVLVAGMSILIASRFYLGRWRDSMALMRAFGANNAKMYRMFAMQLTWIALLSSFIGVIIGYALSLLLTPFLADYFTPLVVAPPYLGMLIGFMSGVLVLWTFAWQAFYSAVKTSPIQILKSVPNQTHNIHWFISFFLLIGLISLMLEIDSIQWIVLGITIISFILFIVAAVMLKLMMKLQTHSKGWFKIALSNLTKEPGLVKIQLVSVGMVLFVLMLMTFVRQDLIQNWQASLPENTPNAFAINIQSDQKSEVDEILNQVKDKTDAPMVRGRLVKVNDQPITAGQQQNERAKRLLQREANIAVMATIPEHNTVIESIAKKQLNYPSVSIEQGIADLFALKIGDKLEFNISGQNYTYQINSIREVVWQSFQLNFFFIIEPVADRKLPITYLSNFLLPPIDQEAQDIAPILTKALALQTPGVLLIDVRKIMLQIQDIMNQASLAVSGLYLFTLLASIGVLFTATLASQQSRIQSWLLLKTLGAKQNDIIKIGLTEFLFLGGFAGLFAATLAQIANILISQQLLNISPSIDITLWLTSIIIGSSLFLLIGLITQWNYLKKSPQDLKRFLSNH